MKSDFTAQVKALFQLAKRYLTLQIDVARFSLAERITLLLGGLAIGLIGVMAGSILVLFLAFTARDLFRTLMSPALANLCVAGCVVLIFAIIFMLRKPLILNPISRLVSKIIFRNEPESKH
ncbi:MAG: hypothetical protein J6L73_08895 [Muribaculaceae bacterium]|nr:hypothetical protein [Muribaculaceae bacterium]